MTLTSLRFVAIALLIPAAAIFTGCQEQAEPVVRESAPPVSDTNDQAEADPVQQARVDALVRPYLDIRESLANDQLQGVPEAFADLSEEAQALSESENTRIRSLAQKLVDSASVEPMDLEQAREAYEGVSTAMIDLVKIVPPSSAVAETLYVAYCPMVEAGWLQKTEKLANPYMGQKMLACGEIKETITAK